MPTLTEIQAQMTELKILAKTVKSKERDQKRAEKTEKYTLLAQEMVKTVKKQFPALTVELSGYWVWVKGDTMPLKEPLRAIGFFWVGSKQSWAYSPAWAALKTRKQMAN